MKNVKIKTTVSVIEDISIPDDADLDDILDECKAAANDVVTSAIEQDVAHVDVEVVAA